MRKLNTCTTLLALFMAGCLPGSGHVEVHGDGFGPAAKADGRILIADAGLVKPDLGAVPGDTGPGTDTKSAPKPDTFIPKPDTTPSTPQPPFGGSVGQTAANFVDIPDCSNKLHSLHPLFKKHKGVLIAMMSPS